jgi:4-amino-4-deoxy-L-arabinose transferase-like glycosyltransferase
LLGLGCGLAVLAKGLIGIVLPGLVFLLYIGIMGEWRRLLSLVLSPAPVVLLAVAAPWFVLMEQRNPGFSQVFFIREHFQRFATDEAKRGGPIYYFVAAFIAGFLPWTLPFGAWLARARPRMKTPDREWLRERKDPILFTLWFFVILVFFSLSKSKLLPYLLPAMPAAAAICASMIVNGSPRLRAAFIAYATIFTLAFGLGLGIAVNKGTLSPYGVLPLATVGATLFLMGAWTAAFFARRGHRRALIAATLGWAGLYLAAVVALPRLAHDLTTQDLALAAANVPGARVVAYHGYPQSLALTLGHAIPVVDYVGELASDGARPPEIFWSNDEFWRRWRAGEPMAVVIRRRALADWTAQGLPVPMTVASNKGYLVVTNVAADPHAPKT